MSPLAISKIIEWVTAILGAAPQVAELYAKAKEFFTVLFTAGKITKQQQDAILLQIDAIKALVDAGITPPSWQVEPDPQSPPQQ